MWACPECTRQFKNTNQVHGCYKISIESLLDKRSSKIQSLYHHLHNELKLPKYRREAVPPDVIFYKTKSTFLAIKLKTKWIEVEFFLDYFLDIPIIKKSLQTSKRRYVYVIAIDEPADVNEELIEWINYSYKLISG